jgi:hypothetical protein
MLAWSYVELLSNFRSALSEAACALRFECCTNPKHLFSAFGTVAVQLANGRETGI